VSRPRLGQVDQINCLPVYHALEEGLLPMDIELVKGTPSRLSNLFFSGALAATLISSIEYPRNADNCFILPGLSVSADGRVASILFFSKIPVTELEGKRVCLTESSDTSAALLKVLFDHYYHVEVQFITAPPNLDIMMQKADGALLVGNDAMLAYQRVKEQGLSYYVTDLGEAWKLFTGGKMVYALWVVSKSYARTNREEINLLNKILLESKEIGLGQIHALVSKAQKKLSLPLQVIEDYFKTIRLEFDEDCRKALLTFYDYAYKSGLIDERVKLSIWGESGE